MFFSLNGKVIKNAEESPAAKMVRKVVNKVAKNQTVDSDEVEILKSLPAQTVMEFGNDDTAVYRFTAGNLVSAVETVNALDHKQIAMLTEELGKVRETIKALTAPADDAHTALLIPQAEGETKVKKAKEPTKPVNPFEALLK